MTRTSSGAGRLHVVEPDPAAVPAGAQAAPGVHADASSVGVRSMTPTRGTPRRWRPSIVPNVGMPWTNSRSSIGFMIHWNALAGRVGGHPLSAPWSGNVPLDQVPPAALDDAVDVGHERRSRSVFF